jgi:epoxyqueuosine reductase
VLIAAGNSGAAGLADACLRLVDDASPLVRGAAAWALSMMLEPAAFAKLAARFGTAEADEDVREEWRVGTVREKTTVAEAHA